MTIPPLATRLKSELDRRKMSQAELARRSGLSTSFVSRLVSGEQGERISRSTLEALAAALDVPASSMLFEATDTSLAIRHMDSQEFIERLKGVCENVHKDNPSSDSKYAFFLGAGCSVSSGIPAAAELVRDFWIKRLCKIKAPKRTDYVAFAKERFPGYAPERASSFYGQLIDALFITPNDRQREIEQLCEGKFPGFGYAALSKLVAHKSTAFNVVLTTNFDDLMADALYLYTEARPLVIHHESLAAFIRPTRMRPLVVKLHGDSRLSPKNTGEETEDLGENLAKHIAMLLNDRGLIFMGYGGADESILKLLTALPEEALPSGVFWLSPSEPTGKVHEWLKKRAGVWVKIKDFDEFMLQAYAAFQMKHPSKAEFNKMFGKYYETFDKMAAKVEKPEDGMAPDVSLLENLAAAREALPEEAHDLARGEALVATKPVEAQKVFEAVAKKPGTSVWAQMQAARTLRDKLHKHHEAVTAFQSALQLAITDSGEGSEQVESVRAELAWTRVWTGDLATAATEIEKAITWGESQTPRDESILARWYLWRSRIRSELGLLKEAEEDIKKSIDWEESQAQPDQNQLAIRYTMRASIRQDRGLLKEAEEDIQKSIDWEEAQAQPNQRELAMRYFLRARVRQDRGLLKEAEEDIQKSIDWGEAQSPRNERSLAVYYGSRAGIRRDQKQYPHALTDIERSLAWATAQQPIHKSGIAVWSCTRATILAEMGRLPEAIADIAACIAWHRQHLPENRHRMARILRDQARIFAQAGDWPAATAAITESLPLHESVFGKDHEWTNKSRAWQAAIAKREVPPRWLDTTP